MQRGRDCNGRQRPNGICTATTYRAIGAPMPPTFFSRACVPWTAQLIPYPGKLVPIDPGDGIRPCRPWPQCRR